MPDHTITHAHWKNESKRKNEWKKKRAIERKHTNKYTKQLMARQWRRRWKKKHSIQMHTIKLKILNIYLIMTVIKMLLVNLKWFGWIFYYYDYYYCVCCCSPCLLRINISQIGRLTTTTTIKTIKLNEKNRIYYQYPNEIIYWKNYNNEDGLQESSATATANAQSNSNFNFTFFCRWDWKVFLVITWWEQKYYTMVILSPLSLFRHTSLNTFTRVSKEKKKEMKETSIKKSNKFTVNHRVEWTSIFARTRFVSLPI